MENILKQMDSAQNYQQQQYEEQMMVQQQHYQQQQQQQMVQSYEEHQRVSFAEETCKQRENTVSCSLIAH